MPKIDTQKLKLILSRNENDVRKVAEIMNDVNIELQLEAEERALKPPAVKKQFVILVSDPDGKLEEHEMVGWVLQIPEDLSPTNVGILVQSAVYDYNATPKGRRMPVETVGEAFEVIPAKFFSEKFTWIKTKLPVQVCGIKNQIPGETRE